MIIKFSFHVLAQDSNCSFPIPSIEWSSPVPERNSDGLFYTLKSKCVGGNASLITTGLRLTYEIKEYNVTESLWINYNSFVPAPKICSLSDVKRVDYTFDQPEHEELHVIVFKYSSFGLVLIQNVPGKH